VTGKGLTGIGQSLGRLRSSLPAVAIRLAGDPHPAVGLFSGHNSKHQITSIGVKQLRTCSPARHTEPLGGVRVTWGDATDQLRSFNGRRAHHQLVTAGVTLGYTLTTTQPNYESSDSSGQYAVVDDVRVDASIG